MSISPLKHVNIRINLSRYNRLVGVFYLLQYLTSMLLSKFAFKLLVNYSQFIKCVVLY